MKPALTIALSLFACSSSAPSSSECNEGKCDTPEKLSHEEQCTNSRKSSMSESRPHFTPLGVRWSCADVDGVFPHDNTNDDRGQEYCEYFSMLHTAGIPAIISDAQGPVFCDAATPCAQGTCDQSIASCVTATTVDTSRPADVLGKNTDDPVEAGHAVTPLDPRLSAGQIDWLAQNAQQKVGECVFTSWHAEIDRPIASKETVGGRALNATTPGHADPLFRMQVFFNSNGAAKGLLDACVASGDSSIDDGFTRACMMCEANSCLPWRKSDPSVCTMAMRIAECGCSIDIKNASGASRTLDLGVGADVELAHELFVPLSRRGFTLGSWEGIGQLPAGCRYVRTGDPQTVTVNGNTVADPNADQTIVACDLKAGHITSATAKDPKAACRAVYGEEVVVHVRAPLPSMATMTCDATKPSCEGVPWDFANL